MLEVFFTEILTYLCYNDVYHLSVIAHPNLLQIEADEEPLSILLGILLLPRLREEGPLYLVSGLAMQTFCN